MVLTGWRTCPDVNLMLINQTRSECSLQLVLPRQISWSDLGHAEVHTLPVVGSAFSQWSKYISNRHHYSLVLPFWQAICSAKLVAAISFLIITKPSQLLDAPLVLFGLDGDVIDFNPCFFPCSLVPFRPVDMTLRKLHLRLLGWGIPIGSTRDSKLTMYRRRSSSFSV